MRVLLLSSLDGGAQILQTSALREVMFPNGGGDGLSIAYIQYATDAVSYVVKTQDFYTSLGIRCTVRPIDLDLGFAPEALDALHTADVLHIPGGNTFHLIHAIRRRGLSGPITDFAASGRPIVALSAGALVLGPSIGSARLGDDDSGHNGDDRGLGIVDFEFFPHWNSHSHFAPDLLRYSTTVGHPIRIVADDEGLLVESGRVTTFGHPKILQSGLMMPQGPPYEQALR